MILKILKRLTNQTIFLSKIISKEVKSIIQNYQADMLIYFPFASATLAGGTGPPLTGSTIQTSPYRAIIFIQFSEEGIANGSQVEVRLLREWRNVVGGSTLEFAWEPFSDALGSACFDPLSVSAAFCDEGL